jgi:hypothetical protein
MDINEWRNEVFDRTMGFPPKATRTKWTPFETAYLELLHEKLKRVASTNAEFTMPHNTRILKAFNEYFEYRDGIRDKNGENMDPLGARTMVQLTSYMGRPGTKLRQLRNDLSKYNTSNDADGYFPTVKDTEIQGYLDGDGVIDLTEDVPAPGEPAQDLQVAPPSPSEKRPELHSAQKSSQAHHDATDNPQPKKKPRWVKPKETAVIPSTPEYILSLKARGYKWMYMPETDDEALRLHVAAGKKSPPDTTWIHQATKDLDDRISRRNSTRVNHEAFNRDLLDKYEPKGAMKDVEDWHKISARRDGAAAVTGLLNAADLPPHGYKGDIRDLARNRLLSEGELELIEARDDAIEKKYHMIERQRLLTIQEEYEASLFEKAKHDRAARLQRDDQYYDSDVTRADDTDSPHENEEDLEG